ncbi:Ser-tRNA(Ala) deacylase AlaX [Streptomyces umbrinus]|uniref:metal-dependent hydrolase n=1 Tax=Streptomyces umbrinus TaxID=67370 RepID=UPI0019CBB81C|nr:metal-dependent hydrolase [Streptomyces umbrinus]MCR3724890.1 Ser-tRNA(Ala) deacylase AlaX [Streptomyces umbrinus]MCX4563898.1 metal-dependent hydrolase [Streptomyces phaeochromogenes]GHH61028.1 alanyl-tRNA synthetase [Streptomyces umbrinus]
MVHSAGALGVGAQVSAYLDDTYLEQVDTRVIAVGEKGGTPWAAVEHCLFHPQGGGQPADRGWLEDTEIIPVRDRESGLVVATVPGGGSLPPLAEGQKVRARIDLRARTAHAALHTAGHLVEAVGRMQGWEMVASNHFPGQARIEFQAPRTDTRLADPEGREEVTAVLRDAVAAVVADDLPVFARCLADGRRVVHLDELHSAPCGGTHVRSLGDLAELALPTLKVKKGRIRVSYSATHVPFTATQVSCAGTHLPYAAPHVPHPACQAPKRVGATE